MGVTSFNEWHEGTQVEPASSTPHTDDSEKYRYMSYGAGGENAYLDLTRKWAAKLDPTAFK